MVRTRSPYFTFLTEEKAPEDDVPVRIRVRQTSMKKDDPDTEFLEIAGQQEILSQIVHYLNLSDVGNLFSVIRTEFTFRPTKALRKQIVLKGLIREKKYVTYEKINCSKAILKSLLIPKLADGVTWGKMRDLNRLMQSIPMDCERRNGTVRLQPAGTLVRIDSDSGTAKFKNYGIKIALPYRCCVAEDVEGVPCDRIVFRRNNCRNHIHRRETASHCSVHEHRLGCVLCLEEEEEEEDDEEDDEVEDGDICTNCGTFYAEIFHCDQCGDMACDACGSFISCDTCAELSCENCQEYCDACVSMCCGNCGCGCAKVEEEVL